MNILEKGTNATKPTSVFRIDGPHQSPPKPQIPHFNTNKNLYPNNKIYQSLNHKGISNATYSVAKNYDKIGKVAKVGGHVKVGAAVGTALLPGIGTVIGGIVGGIIGGVGGSIAGREGGEAVAEQIIK